MKYDFTSIIDRHGMDARAVDFEDSQLGPRHPTREGFDLIPMWVADMNFPTVPTVMERMAHGAVQRPALRRPSSAACGRHLPPGEGRDFYPTSFVSFSRDSIRKVSL